MVYIQPGTYLIERGSKSAAMFGSSVGTPVVFYRHVLHPDLRKWRVQPQHNGSCTIQNVKTGKYLAYPEKDDYVSGTVQPCEWRIEPSVDSSHFLLIVPGTTFVLDVIESRLYQNEITIAFRRDNEDPGQAWSFKPVE